MNAEQNTSPFLTKNNANTPKSKAPLIITISLIAMVIVTAVIVALIIINSPKGSNQETANNTPGVVNFDDSFKYIDGTRLKQTNYTFEDINKGFSYASISFTGTKDITVKHVPKQNPYNYFGGNFSFRVNFDHNGKKIPILIESANAKDANKTIETINQDCENDKNCHSDYLSGAKTLLITKSSVWTFYSSTKNGQLISYTINPFVSEDIDVRDDSTARSILAKVAMTISDDNGSPYIEDMATRLRYPNGKYIKDYSHINEVGENYVKLHYHTGADDETVYIAVVQTPIANVSAKSVSTNPKIESFKHENYDHCYTQDQTYFRVYDGDSAIDICAYSMNGDSSNVISDYNKIQRYLDAI
jgi:hypothetical protein